MLTPSGTSNPILGKIRKLLQLAKSENEHEAASAATRAAELMAEHGLAEAEVRLVDVERKAEPIVKGDATATVEDKKAVAWKGSLASGIAAAHGCKMWWRPCIKEVQGPGYEYTKRGATSVIVFMGRTSNVQAADYTLTWLVGEVDRLADLAWERAGSKGQRTQVWKASFRLGCATRISERLRAQAKERPELRIVAEHDYDKRAPKRERLNRDNPGTALVLLARDAEEVCDAYDVVAKGFSGSKSFSGASSSDGYGAGRSAGERVGLGGGRGLPAPSKRIGGGT